MSLSADPISSPVRFTTREQAQVCASGSLEKYWRLHDPLCARFLNIGKDPKHLPAVKAFFPFIRDASVLQMPREIELLPSWLNLAFHAGFVFGARFSTQAEEILEHNKVESAETLRLLKVLMRHFGRVPATPINLYYVFKSICEFEFKSDPQKDLLQALILGSFNTFKAGLAAATVAKVDPFLVEAVETIASPLDVRLNQRLSWRCLMSSPLLASGRPVWESLAHPLLKLAATCLPGAPRERETIQSFLTQQFETLELTSEDECPSPENGLLGWIRSALEYGRKIATGRPERRDAISEQRGGTKVEAAQRTLRSFGSRPEGSDPERTANAILRWIHEHFDCREPATYGDHLQRVIFSSHVAIWNSCCCRDNDNAGADAQHPRTAF